MNKEEMRIAIGDEITTTWSIGDMCDHSQNFWYRSIPFLWWRRRVKVCTDCGEIIDPKTNKPVYQRNPMTDQSFAKKLYAHGEGE